jgi:PAS domain S-box-containing protein
VKLGVNAGLQQASARAAIRLPSIRCAGPKDASRVLNRPGFRSGANVTQGNSSTKADLIAQLSRLRESERRLRSLVTEMGDPLFCYEFEPPIRTTLPHEAQIGLMYDSTLVECNDVYARLFGADSASDVVGHKLRALFDATPVSLDELFAAVVENGYEVVEEECAELLEDGTRRHFLNSGWGVVRDGQMLRVWGTCRDVTERKQEEELLSRRKALAMAMGDAPELPESLRLLTETVIDICGMDSAGVFLVDPDSRDLDLAFHLRLPPGFVDRVAHCTAKSSSGRLVLSGRAVYAGCEDMGVPLDRERKEEGMRAFAIVPILYQGEVVACLNACSFSLDEVPAFARTALAAIASQVGGPIAKAAELAALRQGRSNLRALLDSLEDPVFVLDPEGIILELNEAVVKRLGYSREELLGQTITKVHPRKRRSETEAIFGDIAAGKMDRHPVPLVRKDGTLVPVETRVVHGSWNEQEALFSVSSDLAGDRNAKK